MFLGDTTNVDYAYIDNKGMILGGSYRPKFIVTGEIDPVEKVVVDFSTIKKSLKAIIDDKETGFDHKLWWIEGYSKGEINFNNSTVVITTPYMRIEGPKDIVKVTMYDESYTASADFNRYCLGKLKEKFPRVNIKMETNLGTTFDVIPQINSDYHAFRYVHGLKNSTSWGCQNIGHGHLSYIAAQTHNTQATDQVLYQISKDIDSAIFAWRDNQPNDNTIKYRCERGNMQMEFADVVKVICLETETTVEYLVEYIVNRYKHLLINAGVQTLFVSEGLSKGACLAVRK